jgi:hypothetical protein
MRAVGDLLETQLDTSKIPVKKFTATLRQYFGGPMLKHSDITYLVYLHTLSSLFMES